MRPLVNYCRWQRVTLLLRGRDDRVVWGELATDRGGPHEQLQTFRYELETRIITLIDGDVQQSLQLDEMGVVLRPSAPGGHE